MKVTTNDKILEIKLLKESFDDLNLPDPEAKWDLDGFTPAVVKTAEEKAAERKEKFEARKQRSKAPDAKAANVTAALGQRLK